MSYLLTPEANSIKDEVITRYESHPRVKAARAGSKTIDADRWFEPNTPQMERVYAERRVLDAMVSTAAWMKLTEPQAQKDFLRTLCGKTDKELYAAFIKVSRQRTQIERSAVDVVATQVARGRAYDAALDAAIHSLGLKVTA